MLAPEVGGSTDVTVRLSTYAISLSKSLTSESWEFQPEEIEAEIAEFLLQECNEFSHFRFIIETRGERITAVPLIAVSKPMFGSLMEPFNLKKIHLHSNGHFPGKPGLASVY